MSETTVLVSIEAEAYVEALEAFPLEEIASPKWTRQHEHMEKLNMQAIISASANETEYVKDALVTFEKIPIVIHELVSLVVWKENVFPLLKSLGKRPKTTFPIYIVLYHEATLVNLLETVMYHGDCCTSAGDAVVDLLDYCYSKLTWLASLPNVDGIDFEGKNVSISDSSTLEELEQQETKIAFDTSLKAISLVRYFTDHLKDLPLAITSRLLNNYDIPVLFASLMEKRLWIREEKSGAFERYDNGGWQKISRDDRHKLTKLEGQIWITLYNLLMDPECQKKYEFNDYKKNRLLKIRSFLNEILFDQIPQLSQMQIYLEQLSIMEPPAAKAELILEQIPEIRDHLLSKYRGKWRKMAEDQMNSVFNPNEADMRIQAQRWLETYNLDVLEQLANNEPKCSQCGEPASKKCSVCRSESYCRRECQVQHWPKHKQVCSMLAEARQSPSSSATTSSKK